MSVGAREAANISAFARSDARDKECHCTGSSALL
jgi:hypothetical protein